MTKVMTVVGTRPEIIRLSEVIKLLDRTVDHVLVHTGQNYDYTLNEVFFEELGLRAPDHYPGRRHVVARRRPRRRPDQDAKRCCSPSGPTRCSCWATPTAAWRR